MKTYEAMFLVDTRHANRDWDRVVGQVNEMIAKHGGNVVRCEKWGERKLAYPINGNKRGVYLLVYFEAEGEAPNRVYREVELSETFLRALILAVDQTPDEIVPGGDDAPDAGEAKPAPAGEGATPKPSAEQPPATEAEPETPAEDKEQTEAAPETEAETAPDEAPEADKPATE